MPRRPSPKTLARGRRAAWTATELVLAIGHEVGNLLAAMRLSAHLLPPPGEGDRGMAEALEDLSAQAGWLLAHVRPLLTDDRESRIRVAPSSVLGAVARALRDSSRAAAPLEVEIPEGLPEVWVDSDALHHVLLTLVRSGREAKTRDSGTIVSARRTGGKVVFTVRDGSRRETAGPTAGEPRGRLLALEIAGALAARDGGALTSRSSPDGTELGLAFPVGPAKRTGRLKAGRRPARGKRSLRKRKRS